MILRFSSSGSEYAPSEGSREGIGDESEIYERERKQKKRRGRGSVPSTSRKKWNLEIKKEAFKIFETHIKNKIPPKKIECEKFLLQMNVTDRTWREVKSLIYNEYKK